MTRTLHLGYHKLTSQWVDAYLQATADSGELYWGPGLTPPLALVALALARLLEALALPPGAIHGAQEFSCLREARIGETVHIEAQCRDPAQHANFRFVTAFFTVRGEQNDTILTGKSTVVLPSGSGDG